MPKVSVLELVASYHHEYLSKTCVQNVIAMLLSYLSLDQSGDNLRPNVSIDFLLATNTWRISLYQIGGSV